MRRLKSPAAIAAVVIAGALAVILLHQPPDSPKAGVAQDEATPGVTETGPRQATPNTETTAESADLEASPSSFRILVTRAGLPVPRAVVSLGRTVKGTGQDGRVDFERCEPRPGEDASHVRLFARAGNTTSKLTDIDCLAPMGGEIVLELRLPGTVQGRVITAESRLPIADAAVYLSPEVAELAKTDESGLFRLENVAPGTYSVNARAAGRLPAEVALVEVESGRRRDIDLALPEAFSIDGVVVDPEGEPVPDAIVALTGATLIENTHLGSAKSGKDGRFLVSQLPPGVALLTAEAPAFAARTVKVVLPAEGLRVVLSRGARIEGFVRDGYKQPAEGVEVMLGGDRGRSEKSQQVVTGEDGHYEFTLLAPGQYVLKARAPLARAANAFVRIEGEETRTADLELRPLTGLVAGRVVAAADGQPIAGASVTAQDSTALTDKNGEFHLEGLDGGRIGVNAAAAGFVPRAETVTVGTTGLVIELPRLLKVRGRVLQRDGEPVRSFALCDGTADSFQSCEAAHTADGRFLLLRDPDPSPPGDATVPPFSIHAEGYLAVVIPRRGGPGETDDLGDVLLESSASVVVHVSDPAGAPAAGARLFLGRGRNSRPIGMTDGNGETRYRATTSGQHCVLASHPTHAASIGCSQVIKGSTGYIEVRLAPASWIAGKVLSQGMPAVGVVVVDVAEGVGTYSEPGGAFRLGPLRAGDHLPVAGEAWKQAEGRSFVRAHGKGLVMLDDGRGFLDQVEVVVLGEGETKTVNLEVGCLTLPCMPPP